MNKTHFVSILPGLTDVLQLPAVQEQCSSALKTLQKAKRIAVQGDATSLKYQKICGEISGILPMASLSAIADEIQVGPHVVRADPVEFKIDVAQIYMIGQHHLHLTQDELNEISRLINPLFDEFNLDLIFSSNGRGYISSPDPIDLQTVSPDKIIGKSVTEYLPQGSQKSYWLRLMTEIQMLLRDSELNQRRLSQGKSRVDALWFWGAGGSFPNAYLSNYKKIYSDDAVILGLAKYLNLPHQNLTDSFEEIIAQTNPLGDQVLLCSDIFLRPHSPDELIDLVQARVYPILSAINARKITSLELYLGDKHCYYMSSNVLRPWWKPWSRK